MDKEALIVAGCVFIGIGFAIRYLAEMTSWGKDLTASQLKKRIAIGYGSMFGFGAIGILLIMMSAELLPGQK